MLCEEYFKDVKIYRFWGIYNDMMKGRYYFEMKKESDNFENKYSRKNIIEWDI